MTNRRLGIVFVIVLLLGTAVPFMVSASPGRLAALGLTDATSWMLGSDEGYFFLNPAAVEKLRPQIWGDLSATDAGLLLNLGGSVNAYLVMGLPVVPNFTGATAPGGFTPLADQIAQLGVGFSVGSVAIGVSAFTGYTAYSDASNTDSDFVVGANSGAIIPLGQALSLDVAAGVTLWSIQRHPVPANDYVATPVDFSALARLSWVLAQNNTMHIFARFASNDRSYSLAGASTARSILDIIGGVSDELTVVDGVLIFAGAYIEAASTTTTTVAATYSIVGNAGGELSLGKDAVARLGLADTFETITTNSGTGVSSTAGAGLAMSGGVGLNIGNLTFDADVNIGLLTNGPYFIMGGAGPGAWTAELSATYYFGKAGT
jgi:hypothetical protein